jgi:hypothetical protein
MRRIGPLVRPDYVLTQAMQVTTNILVVGTAVFAVGACAVSVHATTLGDENVAGPVTSNRHVNSTSAQWPLFSTIDSNRNGYIDRTEAANVPVLEFGPADHDGDGQLNPAEFEAAKSMAPARGGESDVPVGGTGGTPASTGSELQRVPGESGNTK